METNRNGRVLFEDSLRVVIATGFTRRTANAKTGDMIQVWVLVRSDDPVKAHKLGLDKHNCGNCPLRGRPATATKPAIQATCYVNKGQAPLNVWRTWKRGGYPQLESDELFRGRKVRWGAYGDPIYIPLPLIARISALASGWTGYTHQWRNPLYKAYADFIMASVEDATGQLDAVNRKWRTFRVKRDWQPSFSDEVTCPNTTHGVQCADCGLCRGNSRHAKSVVIDVHGSVNKEAVN